MSEHKQRASTDEEADRLAELHQECCLAMKTAMHDWCEKNVPKDFHVAMMNMVAVEIITAALHATNLMLERHGVEENGELANAALDAFTENVMPEFAQMITKLGRGRVMRIGNDDDADEGKNTFTIN